MVLTEINFRKHVPVYRELCGIEADGQICMNGNAYLNDPGKISIDANYWGVDHRDYWGAAVYSEPMYLWNRETIKKIANFTSEFSFRVTSNKDIEAASFSFFMSDFPYFYYEEEYLGFSNSFLTVEFNFESKAINNQVGIHVNSADSKRSKVIPFEFTEGSTVRVNYDSINSNLSVSVHHKDSTIFLSHVVQLKTILPENVSVGFIGKNCTDVKFIISSWSFLSTSINDLEEPADSPYQQSKSKSNFSLLSFIIGLAAGTLLLISLFGGILFFYKPKLKKTREVSDVFLDDEFQDDQEGPRKFSYHELENATEKFNPKRKLGEGGFGSIYSGFLKDMNINIAVKKISGHSNQGRKEYIAEVKIISQLRHKNLVQLIGWCHEKGDLLLVYELMENKSLDKFIFYGKRSLSWSLRYKIARGLASALIYLHEEWKRCVVHRDVKSSNVMLDKSFNAKLGDFGLARLSEHGGSAQTTFMAGTMGYIAPECFITEKSTKESDVYAFGIVALEIACGRKCIDNKTDEDKVKLLEWVWRMYGSGRLLDVIDERILNDDDYEEQQVKQLLIVGLYGALILIMNNDLP
ncbi:putative Kinase [Zostera marina]|uniref:Putative Kinase n=1 Tax=Zostera marina TaxID=29655 RepID=A0A0K9PCE8_ZOSMR|nr:putative Kinase [Zostera marina]